MTEVFLVWSGEYSDVTLHGVYTTRELAERAQAKIAADGWASPVVIETEPLDVQP